MDNIYKLFQTKQPEVEKWFEEKWKGLKPLLYLSCDIRHSGHKIAVVDTNLFPAGFNNLCNSYSRLTAETFKGYFQTYHPQTRKVLLYGEEHTRNKFYLKNLLHLDRLLEKAGLESRIGTTGEFLQEGKTRIDLEEGSFDLYKITRKGNRVLADGYEPELIISNNDFASGVPAVFSNIDQPIIPDPKLGWQGRQKIIHFRILRELLADFSARFDLDLWQIYPETGMAAEVNIENAESLRLLASKIDAVLEKTRKKYDEYGIKETPYVYVKNNRGTYGLGILILYSGEEILTLNRRQKNKLLSSKGTTPTDSFLIQEGIPTIDAYSGYPIEPVIYVVGKTDVGGFFRFHETKNEYENLNSPGMAFSCLCLHKLTEPHEEYFLDCRQKESVVALSRFLARVAALAAAQEAA
ncbi:MAG: glutamate--cysteine ligase [Deltaproteobacteria bacterium]|nr:glutamate--cysteine ligase [Deltaproteobacteria bacterium]